jgi:hypothetical protein
MAALATFGLSARCRSGSRFGTGVAGGATGLVGVLGFLGAATIGIFVLPVAGLLAGAIALTPEG